ncbi:MAG: hypothetical protein AMJ65_04385 [Phycisphaerae bacterium SG8_4]|nr:MAG: hypothetical protein AMJ65_04385 [Phycisphaerae bacterium SG8_4]
MDKKEQLVEAVLRPAGGGENPKKREKLTCADAFELAEKFDAEIAEVGRICNQNNVKICKCQLGCFK